MPAHQFDVMRNLGSAFTSRARSPRVWKDFPYESIKNGESDGVIVECDFHQMKASSNINAAVAYWAQGFEVFGSNGGFITDEGESYGVVTLGSDGDNEGASILQPIPCFKIAQGQNVLCFEARVKTSTITDTKHGFFLGLMDSTAATATVPIAADGTLADVNLVGFHRLEGDGDQVDFRYKANGVTAVTVQADALAVAPYSGALVADTYIKLGMRYEPTDTALGNYYLKAYADNIKIAQVQIPSAAGTDFPNDVLLRFAFAVLNATASTPGDSSIDWIRVGQMGA